MENKQFPKHRIIQVDDNVFIIEKEIPRPPLFTDKVTYSGWFLWEKRHVERVKIEPIFTNWHAIKDINGNIKTFLYYDYAFLFIKKEKEKFNKYPIITEVNL